MKNKMKDAELYGQVILDVKRFIQQREHHNIKDKYENDLGLDCLHDRCTECSGSGIKKDGGPCVHYISCPCPKCTPFY